jgi:ParB-like chromosome segregation protein Spo0J
MRHASYRAQSDRLTPYAKNARTHTDAHVAAIAASIKEWGWTTPALVGEDGGLIAGHARILAAPTLPLRRACARGCRKSKTVAG